MKFIKFTLSLVVLFVIIIKKNFATESNENESTESQFKYGFSIGYVSGYNKSSSDYNDNNVLLNGFKNLLSNKYSDGFYTNADLLYEFYKGDNFSHNVQFKLQFQYIPESFALKETSSVLENGQIVQATILQDASLKLSLFSLNLFYNFRFANKHIGVSIGPTLTYFLNSIYSFSEETLITPTKTFKRGKEVNGKLEGFDKSIFNISLGLDYSFSFQNFEIIPHVIYSPIKIHNNSNWFMKNVFYGVEFRF